MNNHTDFLLDAGAALNERLKGEMERIVDERNEANVLARTLKSKLDHTNNAYRELETFTEKLKAAEAQFQFDIADAKQHAANAIDRAEKRAAQLEQSLVRVEAALQTMHRMIDEYYLADCKRRKQTPTRDPRALAVAAASCADYLKTYAAGPITGEPNTEEPAHPRKEA